MRNRPGFASRSMIVGVAARLFAESGFVNTPVEAILVASGVSRGALYHHFPSKEALFGAVLETTEAHVAACVREAARAEGDPSAALRAGCAAWLDAMREPRIGQIVLIDAPRTIAWRACREAARRHMLAFLEENLVLIAGQGRLQPSSIRPIMHSALAILSELAHMRRESSPEESICATKETVYRYLDAIVSSSAVEPKRGRT